jgi:hypothetical protein
MVRRRLSPKKLLGSHTRPGRHSMTFVRDLGRYISRAQELPRVRSNPEEWGRGLSVLKPYGSVVEVGAAFAIRALPCMCLRE